MVQSQKPTPLDEQLGFALYTASIALNRLHKPILDRFGVTFPQFLVLSALQEEDGRTIGSLAVKLGLESSTITPLVKRLEAAGYVRRSRNPGDAREVHVSLSGRAPSMHIAAADMKDMLLVAGLPEFALNLLRQHLNALRDLLSGRGDGTSFDPPATDKM